MTGDSTQGVIAAVESLRLSMQFPHRDDFACFCGTWDESDLAAFNDRVADMGTVKRGGRERSGTA
jgi:hypothetical protein